MERPVKTIDTGSADEMMRRRIQNIHSQKNRMVTCQKCQLHQLQIFNKCTIKVEVTSGNYSVCLYPLALI